MPSPWDLHYEKLKKYHSVITDSIYAVEKDINQTTVEWLQFCSFVDKRNSLLLAQDSRDILELNETVYNDLLLSKIEDSALINTQPIDVNIKIESAGVKYQVEEEFDSD